MPPTGIVSVVPWGRSMGEYVRMFDLSLEDLGNRVLDCGGGPSSFNAEMAAQGRWAVTCDPIYRFSRDQIAARIDETCPHIMELTRNNMAGYTWEEIGTPEELCRLRLDAMGIFLDDYGDGGRKGRYVLGELPWLPFGAGAFDLALCSHLLFTYSVVLDCAFHEQALDELLRVAREVRVFPLVNLDGSASPHLRPVVERLLRCGHDVQHTSVPYSFQCGTGEMLRIVARSGWS
jgi:hypothetical protein